MIRLTGHPVIAEGNRQRVYDHPQDPGLLIKIPKPETYDASGHLHTDDFFDHALRRATVFRGFLREFREYVELKARHQEAGARLPICEVFGVVQTDLGLGLVYERICDPNGQLSPTLHDLVSTGTLTKDHVERLEEHFRILMEEHVVVGNMNPRNLVYQQAADGPGRFIWIDSFGSKEFIPFRRMSSRLNARKIRKIRERFLQLIESRTEIASAPRQKASDGASGAA